MELSNINAEIQLLGALLRNGDQAAELVSEGVLRPTDFTDPNHQLVMQAITEMRQYNREISLLSVASWMTTQGNLDLIGGRSALDDLLDGAGRAEDALTDILALSTRRELQLAGALISVEAANEGIAPDRALDRAEERLLLLRRRGHHEVSTIGALAGSFITRLNRQRAGNYSDSFYTNLSFLDLVLGGMEQNDFGIIGGRPGDGKSTLIKYIAFLNAILPDQPNRRGVYIGDFEEGPAIFIMKFVAMMTKISTVFLKSPNLLNELQLQNIHNAVSYLENCPLFYDSGSGVTPATYKSRVMKAQRECISKFNTTLKFDTPDYIQRMVGEGDGDTMRAKFVSNACRDMCHEDQLNLPMLATAQLNRTPVDSQGKVRSYNLSDLKETGALEQDASVVIFVERPWIMNPPQASVVIQFPENREQDERPTTTWQVEPVRLFVAKNRNGGAPAYTPMLMWHRSYGHYELLTDYEATHNFRASL